ncbi:MAG: hypothetical protein C5B47_04190 [Verrucomicrobia bacterium]|nr:MAG: hypothetical protein C5B47_04190 [Verrucomicrobiota bacterium]
MRTISLALALLLAACGGTSLTDAPSLDGGIGVTASGPSLGGCPMFPRDNDFNRDVSGDAVDPDSAGYLTFMGAGSLHLAPDFGGIYGQPFLVVPADQPRVAMSFQYASQSDPGPYPFPPDLPIQSDVDKHATVLSQGECKLYETYLTSHQGSGYHAAAGAVFDLMTGAPRPQGWASATAAGLPILPGLARADEVIDRGVINHALVFTAGATAHAYVFPATYSAGNSSAAYAPPMGLRVRLSASFDLSGYTGESLVVLTALKKYGMYLTDTAGGDFWAVAGTLDSRWDVNDLEQLKRVPVSAFDVVKLGSVHSGL